MLTRYCFLRSEGMQREGHGQKFQIRVKKMMQYKIIILVDRPPIVFKILKSPLLWRRHLWPISVTICHLPHPHDICSKNNTKPIRSIFSVVCSFDQIGDRKYQILGTET
jgi:hypothetical protein